METNDVQDIADMAVERDTLRWEVTRLRAELERAMAHTDKASKRCPCCGAELAEGQFYIDPYSRVSAAAPLRDGWRLVEHGETLQEGDEWWDESEWVKNLYDGDRLLVKAVVRRRVSLAPDPLRDALELARDEIIKMRERLGVDSYALPVIEKALDALAHPAPEAGESEGEK